MKTERIFDIKKRSSFRLFGSNNRKPLTVLLIAFLVLSSFLVLWQMPQVKATSGTFGNTHLGEGQDGWNADSNLIGSNFVLGEDCLAKNMTAGLASLVTVEVTLGIYNSTGYKVAQTLPNTYNNGAGIWVTFLFSSPVFLATGTYKLVAMGNDTFYDQYDTVSNALERDTGSFYPTLPSTWTASSQANEKMSIYVSYDTVSTSPSLAGNPAYDYTMVNNATSNYIIAKNGAFVYNNADPTVTFGELASTYANNSKTAYINCSFTEASAFTMTDLYNITFVFDPSSTLTMGSGVGNTGAYTAILDFRSCTKITVVNATLNGDKTSQGGTGSHTQGLSFSDCNDCQAQSCTISNCRMYGFVVADNVAGHVASGIINSTVTGSGWNDLTLGSPTYLPETTCYTNGSYAINCTVGGSSDCGISTYGNSTRIIGCTVNNVTNTIGGGGKANYGIALEGFARFNIVVNNTISNCSGGIVVGTGDAPESNLVKDNYVENTTIIGLSNSGTDATTMAKSNVFFNNTVHQYGTGYVGTAISLLYTQDDIVSFNKILSTEANAGECIYVGYSLRCFVANNTVTTPTVSDTTLCLYAATSTNSSIFSGNNVQGNIGIYVHATANNNRFIQNNVTNCTTSITNNGVGTILNPTSSPTYMLTVCSIDDGSAQGTYVYSNTTQKTLTSSGVINVDGTNETSPYTLTMNKDHFVYALNSLVLTNEPTPTPTPEPNNNNGGDYRSSSSSTPTPPASNKPLAVAPTQEPESGNISPFYWFAAGLFILIMLGFAFMQVSPGSRRSHGRRRSKKIHWKRY